MSRVQLRRYIDHVRAELSVSERRAGRVLGQHRSKQSMVLRAQMTKRR